MKRTGLLLVLLALICGIAYVGAQSPPPVPALPDSPRITGYSLSGSTCNCSVGFAIYGDGTDVDNWLDVFVNGVSVLSTDPAHGWSLSSATGALGAIPRPITNAVLNFALPQTGTVTIAGARRPRRLTQFQENRGVTARDLNQAMTDQVAMLREAWDIKDSTVRGQPGDMLKLLPSASGRAGQFLAFDASGQPIVQPPTSAGGIVPVTGTPSVGFVPIGTGSAAVWGAIPAQCTLASSAGFINDGIADNLAPWNAWVTSIGANSACLQLSAGTYRFSAQASATLSASQTLQISGAGQDVTELWFSAGNGINLTMNTGTPVGFINGSSATIANLAITTSLAGGVDGLTIHGNTTNGYIPRQTNIRYVAFRGHVNTAWWRTNIALTDLSNVVIDGVGIYGLNNTNTNGVGISYVGTNDSTTPTLINVTNFIAFFLNVGISASGAWQGLNASQINIIDATTGVSCTAVTVQPECNISNSQFNTVRHGVVYDHIQTSTISNTLFYQGAYAGLVNGDAILSLSTGSSVVVANNTFSGFTIGGATPNCVDISGGGSPVNNAIISANTFAGCTTNIIAGTSSDSIAIGNIDVTGTPFTGGGSFWAFLGPALLSFPDGNITVGGYVQTGGFTIPGLPVCSGTTIGMRAYVTNGASPAFMGVVGAAGAVVAPVFCNGTSWLYG